MKVLRQVVGSLDPRLQHRETKPEAEGFPEHQNGKAHTQKEETEEQRHHQDRSDSPNEGPQGFRRRGSALAQCYPSRNPVLMNDPSGSDVGLGAVVANTRSKVLEQRANSSERRLISHIVALLYLSDDAKHDPSTLERTKAGF
jgi:hypothetical protein